MGTKTASVVVDGLYSGGWDAGTWTDIDEGTDSPNDADVIESYGAAFDDVSFTITMPADFISMNSATIKLRGRSTGTKTYKKNLQHIRVYSPAESTYMFDIYSYSNPTFSTSWVTYEIEVDIDPAVISGGINDKNTWDGAVVQIRANAESDGVCEISALQIDINYEGSGASVYNQTGSGGIEGAGTAIESVDAASSVYDETASGGIVGGGVGSANTNIVIDATDGLLAAGVATESVDAAGAVYDETASGGIVSAGSAQTNTIFAIVSDGGIVSAGTASANTNIAIVSDGGILAAGTAIESVDTASAVYDETASGGIVGGGIALVNTNYAIVSTGGLLAAGTAIESEAETITASGGIVAAGTASANTNIVITADGGGLLAAGTAIESVDTASAVYNETASGGIVSAGSAQTNTNIVIVSTGGLVAAGTAIDSEAETITASGGIGAAGSAIENRNIVITSAGGLSASGSIAPCVMTDIDAAGGIVAAGLVDAYTISEIAAAGGAIIAGAAEIIESETVNVSGGAICSGSAIENTIIVITSAGGLSAAGTATNSASVIPVYEIEHALHSYLSDVLDCSVYVAIRPQNTDLPAVTFRRTSGGYFHCLDGAVDFANPYFDFEIFSKNWSECISISETIRQALQGFSGVKETREIYFATLTDEGDSYYAPADGSSKGTYSTTQTYRVMYKEN